MKSEILPAGHPAVKTLRELHLSKGSVLRFAMPAGVWEDDPGCMVVSPYRWRVVSVEKDGCVIVACPGQGLPAHQELGRWGDFAILAQGGGSGKGNGQ